MTSFSLSSKLSCAATSSNSSAAAAQSREFIVDTNARKHNSFYKRPQQNTPARCFPETSLPIALSGVSSPFDGTLKPFHLWPKSVFFFRVYFLSGKRHSICSQTHWGDLAGWSSLTLDYGSPAPRALFCEFTTSGWMKCWTCALPLTFAVDAGAVRHGADDGGVVRRVALLVRRRSRVAPGTIMPTSLWNHTKRECRSAMKSQVKTRLGLPSQAVDNVGVPQPHSLQKQTLLIHQQSQIISVWTDRPPHLLLSKINPVNLFVTWIVCFVKWMTKSQMSQMGTELQLCWPKNLCVCPRDIFDPLAPFFN